MEGGVILRDIQGYTQNLCFSDTQNRAIFECPKNTNFAYIRSKSIYNKKSTMQKVEESKEKHFLF